MEISQPDPDKLKMFSFVLYSQLSGAVTAGMIHLGDRLGLYGVLAAADAPLSSSEIAVKSDLHERWVREWASNQVAARLVEADHSDPHEPRFSLTPEGRAVLADESHPAFGMGMFHRLPSTMERLAELPDCFATGRGFDYDAHGHDGAVGIERSFEPWSNAHLVPVVLPTLDGVVERLRRGIRVADIGCGAGSAVCTMAAAFPDSSFVGYDISHHALSIAREKATSRGLKNVSFVDVHDEGIPTDSSFGFVTTFDCIHDMTRPREMVRTIRRAIADDGVWLLVDIKARETLEQNVTKNPMAALMYGISVLSCMASALSEENGEGLGTLGLPASKAEEFAREAGFRSFSVLPVDHSVNAFYEIRP
ncbi:MAG: class I SAM-dependent methyltransferase [Actinobacteria bacterium]|nr:class I SAM-dependent methyltransferase [Actinomycetota bacterium]NBP53335.1 class I SAM-dependent methyltransferase [Actinomycetota bacterium]